MWKLILASILVTLVFSSAAANELPTLLTPITVAQQNQVVELARLGKGVLGSIHVSPRGDVVAVTSSIGVWLYDPSDWLQAPRLIPMPDFPRIQFSPDGKRLVSWDWPYWDAIGQTVALWDVDSGQMETRLRITTITGNVIFSPDGSLLAAATYDGQILLLDSRTTEVLARIHAHDSATGYLYFSPDGSLLASRPEAWGGPGSWITEQDGYVRVWDVQAALANTNMEIDQAVAAFQFGENLNSVGLTLVSTDNRLLAVAVSDEPAITIFDLQTQTPVDVAPINDIAVWGDRWLVSYHKIAESGSDSYPVALWESLFDDESDLLSADFSSGIALIPGLDKSPPLAITEFSIYWPDSGKTMPNALGDLRGSSYRWNNLLFLKGEAAIYLYELNSQEVIGALDGFAPSDTRGIGAIFDVQGTRLAYSLGDGLTHLADSSTLEMLATLPAERPVVFSPDGNYLVTEFKEDGRYSQGIWHLPEQRLIHTFVTGAAHFSPNSRYLISIPQGDTPAELLDLQTGQVRMSFDGIRTATFNNRSDRLMLASYRETQIWDITTSTLLHVWQRGGEAFDFRPNGRPVMAWSFSDSYCCSAGVVITDVNTGERRHITEFSSLWQSENGGVYPSFYELTFSPAGDFLAFISSGFREAAAVFLWDLRTNERHVLADYTVNQWGNLTFSPDQSLIAYAGFDYISGGAAELNREVYVHDTETGARIAVLVGHSAPVDLIDIRADNRLIITTGDSTIRLWGVPG